MLNKHRTRVKRHIYMDRIILRFRRQTDLNESKKKCTKSITYFIIYFLQTGLIVRVIFSTTCPSCEIYDELLG